MAAESVTANVASFVPLSPSGATVAPAIETAGTGGGGGASSSSVIVPVPGPSAIVALTGAERLTMNVSSGSSSRVAVDRDGEGLGRLARGEGHRAARGRVVARLLAVPSAVA